MSERIFMKITNKDIANKIDKVFVIVQELKDDNTKEHSQIIIHQKETNGKVKLNEFRTKISLGLTTAVIIALMGLLTKFIIGG